MGITVTPADAKLIHEMHHLIKGQDIRGQRDAIAVEEEPGNSSDDYLENARQRSLCRE
jgi:hypothetical protein